MISVGSVTQTPRCARAEEAELLRGIYERLLRAFGPQQWWPARSSFEMMVGAVLTQATNWRNVEQAIRRLRRSGALNSRSLLAMPMASLERAVRPAGYFRQKARRLKALAAWYAQRYGASRRAMARTSWRTLRKQLLSLHGIGPETADAILLYACGKPVFVVDTYAIRVFFRHRLIKAATTYEKLQHIVMQNLPARAPLYNEFHALLVAVGKRFCHRADPDCSGCPLQELPHTRDRI